MMQAPKTRGGCAELPLRASPAAARPSRPPRIAGSDPSSAYDSPSKKSPNGTSPKLERCSPISLGREKKRPTRMSDLELQLSRCQEELRKTKDQLISSELSKKRAQQETEEAKRQLLAMSAKVKEAEFQLEELSTAEESRLLQLRKISHERDQAWQSELQALEKQHYVDSAALASAMNETHKLKLQLETLHKSQAEQSEQSEAEHLELQELKQGMVEAMSAIEELRLQLRDSQGAKEEAEAMFDEAKQHLEEGRTAIDSLLTDGSKLIHTFSLVVLELQESRCELTLLEEMVESLQKDQSSVGSQALVGHRFSSLEMQVVELRAALEASMIRLQQEEILSILQTRCAFELLEQMMVSDLKEAKLEAALNSARSEVIMLKANLFDKGAELRNAIDANKKLVADLEKERVSKVDSLLMEKEAASLSVVEENDQVKLEDKNRANEAASAEVKTARAAEEEALMRVKSATEAAHESYYKAAMLAEQLEAAQTMNAEKEAESKRIRVQGEQWRKAAETAMALLTVGTGGDLVGRTVSLDSSLSGKLMSLPFSDELDDETPSRKNRTVLRKISGIWKK